MKKALVIILNIVLCVALAGVAVAVGGEGKIFSVDNSTSEPTEEITASESDKNTELVENNSTISTETKEIEVLSAEDKALKAEIAKVNDTKIDFRTKKQDKIGNKTYDMTYKELGNNAIMYSLTLDNGKEAEFTYHLKSGKLLQVIAPTGGLTKTEQSITLEEARKIAVNIAKQYCDFSVYQITEEEERFLSYHFVFSKKILGYNTADGIQLDLNFNGDIYILQVCTDIFKNENFVIDEATIVSELENKINTEFPDREGYTVDEQRISVSEGKPVMEYYVTINVGYPIPIIYQIPIE